MSSRKSRTRHLVEAHKNDYEQAMRTALDMKNPLDFLVGLSDSDSTEAFNVSEIAQGRKAREGGTLDLEALHEEVNICSLVRDVINDKSLVPRDVKFDDSSLPKAKNIYEWLTLDKFSGSVMRPYLEQMVTGIILFSEYCVAEGSYTHTSKGLVRIEDLVPDATTAGMDKLTVTVSTDSGARKTSHGGLTSKRRKCLKVTYANGQSIIVTPNHQVQVLNSKLEQTWVEAQNLEVGEFGVMPYGQNVWPSKPYKLPKYNVEHTLVGSKRKTFKPACSVTPELARLTGYLIADGGLNKDSLNFINLDVNLVEDFVHCCEVVFQQTPITTVGEKHNSTEPYFNVALHGRAYVDYLYHIGFEGTASYNKFIPDYILQSDKDTVVHCLRALFDCDGYVSEDRVGITLSCPETVQQIQLLMQNLGIHGAHREYLYDHKKNPAVSIPRAADDYKNRRGEWITKHGDSIRKYAAIIGSKHVDKADCLLYAKAASVVPQSHRQHMRPGCVPYAKELFEYSKTLRTCYHDKGLSHTKFGRREYANIRQLLDDSEFTSFFSERDPKVIQRLTELEASNYAFAEIVNIEDAGYHRVFDLTVPSVENFLCNGVVVHNCPRCSDTEWLFRTHKVDDSYTTLLEKVSILENGVCPQCQGRKSAFVSQDEMHFYQELALRCGQRCVVGSTTILTEDGLMEIGEYKADRPQGFSDMNMQIHDSQQKRKASRYFVSEDSGTYHLTLADGNTLTGTYDHPVLTDSGFLRLGELTSDNHVVTRIGQNCFGDKEFKLATASDKARAARTAWDENQSWYGTAPSYIKETPLPVQATLTTAVAHTLGVIAGAAYSNAHCVAIPCEGEVNALSHRVIRALFKEAVTRTSGEIEIEGDLGVFFFQQLFGNYGRAFHFIGVPLCVRQGSKGVAINFLRGLFDVKSEFKGGQLQLVSDYRSTHNHVKAMLHNLGIYARSVVDKRYCEDHTLVLDGRALEKFKTLIGFTEKSKHKELLAAIREQKKNPDFVDMGDLLPPVYLDRMRTLVEESTLEAEVKTTCLRKLDVPRLTKPLLLEVAVACKGHTVIPNADFQVKAMIKRARSQKEMYVQVHDLDYDSDPETTYDFTVDGSHMFTSNGMVSSNSGKTAMTGGMFFPYQTHRLLKMQNPNAVYGLPQNNMLHMTFCALTYAQAKDTLWEFYYGVLVGSTWFKNYHSLLRHYEDRYGESLLKFNDTFIQYRHRSILAYPAGPDKRVLRGKTRAASGIDEIGWFDNAANSTKVKTSAKEVYIALERSLLTVRAKAKKLLRTGNDDAVHGMFMNVSSPSSQQDKICELTRQAVDSPSIFGSIRPTWEMNPTITQEDLAEEFQKNHGDAMRDYGAEPPLSNSPFIDNHSWIMEAYKNSKSNSVKYRHASTTSGKGINKKHMRYAYIEKQRRGKSPSILSIDAGYTNNSFACVVTVPYGTGVEIKAIVEIMTKPGLPLNYTLIYEDVMKPLIENWNVKVLLADRWNSLKILSDAEADFDITATQYSLKYRDMWMCKTLLEQTELKIPKPKQKIKGLDDILRYDFDAYPECFEYKPVEHLILQLLTVQDTGSQILKGDGLTDDIWRALALGAWGITGDKFVEELNGPDAAGLPTFAGALGTSRLGSGGAGGNSKSGTTSTGLALGSMKAGRK